MADLNTKNNISEVTATIIDGSLCITAPDEFTHLFLRELGKVVSAVASFYEGRPMEMVSVEDELPDGTAFYEFFPKEGELTGPVMFPETVSGKLAIAGAMSLEMAPQGDTGTAAA